MGSAASVSIGSSATTFISSGFSSTDFSSIAAGVGASSAAATAGVGVGAGAASTGTGTAAAGSSGSSLVTSIEGVASVAAAGSRAGASELTEDLVFNSASLPM